MTGRPKGLDMTSTTFARRIGRIAGRIVSGSLVVAFFVIEAAPRINF